MRKITANDIKAILAQANLYGQTLSVEDIKNLIRKSYNLSAEDYRPYTSARVTKYTYWEAQVQRTLYHLSKAGIITHYPTITSYLF